MTAIATIPKTEVDELRERYRVLDQVEEDLKRLLNETQRQIEEGRALKKTIALRILRAQGNLGREPISASVTDAPRHDSLNAATTIPHGTIPN